VENRFNTKIKSLYSDNGGEHVGLKTYLSIHGISHYTTAPHTPQQNGMSERRHRHLVETGLTLLTDARMPLLLALCISNCCLSNQSHAHCHPE
jgi:transposase InsO family protein